MTVLAAQNGTESGTSTAQERRRTAQLSESLPEGIRIGRWSGERRKVHYVRWGPDRKVESFATESDRNDRAAELQGIQLEQGTTALGYDHHEWKEYRAVIARTGATIAQLEAAWLARAPEKAPSMAVVEAVAKYLALRLSEGLAKDGDTHRHIKKHLAERFAPAFPAASLADLSADGIRAWLAELKNPETGQPMTPTTVRNHRKDLNTFLKRCVEEEWMAKNPCAKVKPPKVKVQDKAPMPAQDLFQLFKANRARPIAGRMALELFGSLRASSAERSKKEWIKWEKKGLHLPGAEHKSEKTLFRQGHPEALWEWLAHAGDACWTAIHAGNYDAEKSRAFVRAGVTNPGNGLRRSCASYQLAIKKSVGPVSYLMQHKHTSTTAIYEGVADELDARRVMAITPANTLLSWEELCELIK